MKTNKVFLRILVLVFGVLMMISTFALAEPLKIVMIFPSAITSEAWNIEGYAGLMRAKNDFDIEVSYQESVLEGELAGVLRSCVAEGFDLIIVHELSYTDVVMDVAEDHPDAMFAIVYGFKSADNVASITGTNWEANSLAGAVAGAMTETNTVGFMIATDSPIAHNYLNAGFIYGARWTNPEVKVLTTHVGSWDDVVKAKELTGSMIKGGADIVFSQSGKGNIVAIQESEAAGIWAIGCVSDMSEIAPQTVVANVMYSVDSLVYGIIEDMLKGDLHGLVVKGIKDGTEDIAFSPLLIDKIPEDGMKRVMELRQIIIDGKITIEQIREELTKANIEF